MRNVFPGYRTVEENDDGPWFADELYYDLLVGEVVSELFGEATSTWERSETFHDQAAILRFCNTARHVTPHHR